MIKLREILELRKLTTYEVGLLQTKAYRNLKRKSEKSLEAFKISSVEWAFLGQINNRKDGVRSKELASLLGVEAPFITSLAPKFEKLQILEYRRDTLDKRAKKIYLTDAGCIFVRKVESHMREESKKWLEGLSIKEILTFIKVLKKLS